MAGPASSASKKQSNADSPSKTSNPTSSVTTCSKSAGSSVTAPTAPSQPYDYHRTYRPPNPRPHPVHLHHPHDRNRRRYPRPPLLVNPMTKSFQLTLNTQSTYYTAVALKKVKQGSETFHTKINAKALCVPFIKFLLNSQSPPTKVKLTISTDEIPGSLKVYVTKSGFYRWYYLYPNFPIHGGLPPFSEEILNKLFPNEPTNGLNQTHPLWIKPQLP